MRRIFCLLFASVLATLALAGCGTTAPVIDSTSPDSGQAVIITAGQSQTFSVTAHDPKNLTLSYAWTVKDVGTLSEAGNSATLATTAATDGTVEVVVANSKGGTTTVTWNVSVTEPQPPAPANLAATGSQTKISLAWDPSAGATKYYIYRGTDPGALTKLDEPVSNTYEDTSAAEGTVYYYEVTAVGNAESSRSNRVDCMKGTPVANFTGNFTADAASSPWVVTGNIGITGYLEIASGASVYVYNPAGVSTCLTVGAEIKVFGELHVLPGTAINLAGSTVSQLYVAGLLDVEGTADQRVNLAGTSAGFYFSMIVADSASQIRYADVRGLAASCSISSCSPLIEQSRFEMATGCSGALSFNNSGSVVHNNLFLGMGLYLEFTQQAELDVRANVFMTAKPPLMFQFDNNGTLGSSQFGSNVFQLSDEATTAWTNCDVCVYDNSSSVTITVPLGSNYFFRGLALTDAGTPITSLSDFTLYDATATYDNTGLLSDSPDNAGPSWDDWTDYLN